MLQVLVLNTNVYYMFNTLGTDDADPCQQFAWLEEQLKLARRQQKKVKYKYSFPDNMRHSDMVYLFIILDITAVT